MSNYANFEGGGFRPGHTVFPSAIPERQVFKFKCVERYGKESLSERKPLLQIQSSINTIALSSQSETGNTLEETDPSPT